MFVECVGMCDLGMYLSLELEQNGGTMEPDRLQQARLCFTAAQIAHCKLLLFIAAAAATTTTSTPSTITTSTTGTTGTTRTNRTTGTTTTSTSKTSISASTTATAIIIQ